nr:MAG TPA: hypothetical protein [Bacteriophage sp.]
MVELSIILFLMYNIIHYKKILETFIHIQQLHLKI